MMKRKRGTGQVRDITTFREYKHALCSKNEKADLTYFADEKFVRMIVGYPYPLANISSEIFYNL